MTKLLRFFIILAMVLVLLLAPGCWPFGRKQAKQLPPTPIPPAQPRKQEKVETPTPPKIQSEPPPAAQIPPPSVEAQGQPPAPPRPRPSKRNRRVKQPTVAEEPPAAQAPPAGTPPAAPQPRLGEMLSPEELREHVKNYDHSLRETQNMLAQIQKRTLTADQSQSAARIRTFLAQAEETRRSDLVAAVNLARRAELLARDLLSHLP
ncbi:MAG: hypothetical protein LLG20_08405 [Acidobacteriales bacterium]|nr:hypothetical protein [Terriglobales bacterium]